jgi:hypothetical protein
MTKQISRRPPAHRNAARRLDPYTVQGTTITLEEYRRVRASLAPVHIVLRQEDQTSVA